MRHTIAWHWSTSVAAEAAIGCGDEVFEPPAALQCVIDCGNQRRPPGAGLEGCARSVPMSSASLDSQGTVGTVVSRLTWVNRAGLRWRQIRHHSAAAA